MNTYTCPERFYDHHWLENRLDLIRTFESLRAPVTIDFSSCTWIDLQPLADLLLQSAYYYTSGGTISFAFKPVSRPQTKRVVAFLLDAGFFEVFKRLEASAQRPIRIQTETDELDIDTFFEQLTTQIMPRRALDYETLVPCVFTEAAGFEDRNSVFEFCNQAREEAIGRGRARALRLPVPLIYQTKIFFSSILPELIDNVRIHKRDSPNSFFVFYLRLRRRDDEYSSVRRVAEPRPPLLSRIKQMSRRYWEYDIIEAVFSDDGPSIQDTWIRGWKIANLSSRKRIPRIPQTNQRVDGPIGDKLILSAVFQENLTSLTAEERVKFGLPVRLTGLKSIRETLRGAEFAFSVKSGESNIIIASPQATDDSDGERREPVVKLGGRYPKLPGVHFFFRFTAAQGRALNKWLDGAPAEGIENTPDWWSSTYPERFRRAHVTDRLELPAAELLPGDVVICRLHHLEHKNRTVEFLYEIMRRRVNIVFAELPPPIALGLFQFLNYIIPSEFSLFCPIVTNTLHLALPGSFHPSVLEGFAREHPTRGAHWWGTKDSPIKSLREVILRTRQFDSKDFWAEMINTDGAFLREPIKWHDAWILNGGYLSFSSALRSPRLRKILRKRLTFLVQGLRASRVVASTEWLRHLTAEIRRNTDLEDGERVAVIGNIAVTGETLKRAGSFVGHEQERVYLPVFRYPTRFINSETGDELSQNPRMIRALDWIDDPAVNVSRDDSGRQNNIVFSRKGNTEEVRRKPDKEIRIVSRQTPEDAYDAWQRNSILNIGHFSYGPHHYYMWLDLIWFINSRTSDAHEMLESMVNSLRDWSPEWIFYSPHEVCESLVDRLIEFDQKRKARTLSSDRFWPVTSLRDLENAHSLQAGVPHPGRMKGTAVYIDDAMVTGLSIRKITARLHNLGFETVHSLVILDRGEPDACLQMPRGSRNRHFSWWSLAIPPVGSSASCPICRGVSAARALLSKSTSDAILAALQNWLSAWSSSDNLSRFESRLKEIGLTDKLTRRIGSTSKKNVVIRSSLAACTHALDISGRFDYFDYVFDNINSVPKEALTEIFCGVLLLGWDRLDESKKGFLIERLLERLWGEDRPRARSLIAIAIISLEPAELERIRSFLANRVLDTGFPNLDSAIFGFALAHLTSTSDVAAARLLSSWRTATPSNNPSIRRTNALIDTMCAGSLNSHEERFALQVIGYPGRGERHLHIYDLLKELEDGGSSAIEEQEKMLLLRAYLEPVRRSLKRRQFLLKSEGIYEHLRTAFAEFYQLVRSDYVSIDDLEKLDDPANLSRVCRQLRRFLSADIYGKHNIRQMLSRENVHYVPYIVKYNIDRLVRESRDSEQPIHRPDYKINYPSEAEAARFQQLLSAFRFREDALLEEMQRLDIVAAELPKLETVLNDCLADVVHPKDASMPMSEGDEPTYMEVLFRSKGKADFGSPGYWVVFRNRATEELASRSRGRSWIMTSTIMESLGGEAMVEFERGILVRSLGFPLLRSRLEA